MPETHLPHLFLPGPSNSRDFTRPGGGSRRLDIPKREDIAAHAALLTERLARALAEAENELAGYEVARGGVYLEFRGEPGHDLVIEGLENLRSKNMRVLNIRTDEVPVEGSDGPETKRVRSATVFVKREAVTGFADKIQQYAEERTKQKNNPRHNALMSSIADIRNALVEQLWTDAKELLPDERPEWCEAWLSSDDPATVQEFEEILASEQITTRAGTLYFPERAVKVIQVNSAQLARLRLRTADIAEFRRAKETAAFWMKLPNREQAAWVEEMLDRIEVDRASSVAVCVLDTGVNNGHPLLAPLLSDDDCHAVDDSWGKHDHLWHGTAMAGLAAYGNLAACLETSAVLRVAHHLESVKLLPPKRMGENDANLWGYVTAQAISRAEIHAADRLRVICMAVTATDGREQGRPSSWSGELDQLASGASDDMRRLVLVSAGNGNSWLVPGGYPVGLDTDAVHDPAQAWNVISVGAHTELDDITDSSLAAYQPLAPRGALSPFTSTSLAWEDRWPIKPDIVMEGGNVAHDATGFITECDDLSLLSTYYMPQEGHFFPFTMTSAATAQAAWFAAQIQATYPRMWPETVRALMIHSADWTAEMLQQATNGRRTDWRTVLRRAGYGVPTLARALQSAENALTLIAEAEIQPFEQRRGRQPRTKDMHLYELPWPRDVLLGLPESTEVSMRITLSYFVEPGPGERGWQDRYRYPSHGLRFELNAPSESRDEFVRRINAAARDADDAPETESATKHWRIGPTLRNRGSVHSDIWEGTAAELATSNLIAITPIAGWWRYRSHLGKVNRGTRYALVVTISTPDEDVDLYTPVATQIGVTVPVEVTI